MRSDVTIEQSQRLLVVSGVIDLLLGVVKIAVGVVASSGALVADGIHSLSDLVTDVLVWLFNRIGVQAPDEEHPYGHARFETFGTFILGSLLIAVAAWIAYGLAMQLLTPTSAESAASIPPAAFTGIFAISYILGLLVFFAPAGLGVREVALTVLLTPWLGTAAATAVALLTRVVHTAGDFAIAALAWAIGRSVRYRQSDD